MIKITRALVTLAVTIGGLFVCAGCPGGSPPPGSVLIHCAGVCQDAQGNSVPGNVDACAPPNAATEACKGQLSNGNLICNGITAVVTGQLCSGAAAASARPSGPRK